MKLSILIASIFMAGCSANATTLQASYFFQNSLGAQQSGAPSLTATDPLGTSGFVADQALGRTVYAFNGNTTPAQQAGLTFNNSAALLPNSSYSVEMYFEFTQRLGGWRRILDVQNRQSDDGLYVNPSNNLDIYPVSSGLPFSENAYHDVTLVDNSGAVTVYLDGALALNTVTGVMDINNPQNVLNLFLDNSVGGGIGEYSSGTIAALRFYSGTLTAQDAASLAADPFQGSMTSVTPEPTTLLLLSGGLVGLGLFRRFRK